MSERRHKSETRSEIRAGLEDAGKMIAIIVGGSLLLYELFIQADGCAGMKNPCPPTIEQFVGNMATSLRDQLLRPTAH